jgi:hypothetical protein
MRSQAVHSMTTVPGNGALLTRYVQYVRSPAVRQRSQQHALKPDDVLSALSSTVCVETYVSSTRYIRGVAYIASLHPHRQHLAPYQPACVTYGSARNAHLSFCEQRAALMSRGAVASGGISSRLCMGHVCFGPTSVRRSETVLKLRSR